MRKDLKNSRRSKVQEEIVESIKKNNYRGVINVSPRVGKSKCVIDSIRDKGHRNIYITCPNISVKKSWYSEFKQWKLKFTPEVLCFRSISKIPTDADLIIIDEVHLLSEGNYKDLKKLARRSKILALSGTISPDTLKLIKLNLGLSTIYKYSFSKAISEGIISDFEIYTIPCTLDSEIKNVKSGSKSYPRMDTELGHYNYLTKNFEKFKKEAKIDYSKKKLKDYYSRQRQFFIYESNSKLYSAKKLIDKLDNCLIFTGLTKQADILSEYSYHSKNKDKNNLDKFSKGLIKKLSVISMVDVGVTLKNLKTVVIHQAQSNSETLIQKILRACNLDKEHNIAKIYIFYYKDTVDEDWMNSGLKQIDRKYIKDIIMDTK